MLMWPSGPLPEEALVAARGRCHLGALLSHIRRSWQTLQGLGSWENDFWYSVRTFHIHTKLIHAWTLDALPFLGSVLLLKGHSQDKGERTSRVQVCVYIYIHIHTPASPVGSKPGS